MTSAGQLAAVEHWQRTPHPYQCAYPRYLCTRCELWPGHPVHREGRELLTTDVDVSLNLAEACGTRVTA